MARAITDEQWERLSAWFNRWLTAEAVERARLRAEWAAAEPDLVEEADALAAGSTGLPHFLQLPALLLEARTCADDDPTPLAAGALIGPYEIVGFLARGGMGEVYRATDTRLRRDVALKVLSATKTADSRRVERFMQEARVTAALDHPNVVRVYDVGGAAGGAYLVSELLDGETLRARIDRGAMPVTDAIQIGRQIATGLAAAHAAGLVHRDLKPENIFLTRGGTAKLLDFGIAKLTQNEAAQDGFSTLTGVVLGTAGYLAPEQIRGGPIDPRADLFALGAVLFEMLTGARAFGRAHLVETLHAILHDDPPSLAASPVPAGVAAIVLRLLEKAAGARFQSAAEVIDALDTVKSAPSSGDAAAAAVRRQGTSGARGGWRARRGIAGVAALLMTLGSWWYTARGVLGPSPAPGVTLAVMPFRTMPAEASNDLLQLGLADVFISRLSQLPGIRVLPLTATRRVASDDPLEAARALGANRVLTVSLQVDEGRVRATPELRSTSADRPIWTTTFDADAASVFTVQDIIVTRVLEELAPQLGARARRELGEAGTRHAGAFAAYLQGRTDVLRPTRAELLRAAAAFEEAVTHDPAYADAWAGLATAYRRLPVGGDGRPDWMIKAKGAARRVLDLTPEHPEALSTLGTVAFWYDWEYGDAEELLRRAVDLQPSSADLAVSLAHLLSNLGRHDEALGEIRRARAMDPAWPVARSLEGQFLFMARRFDESLAELDALVRIEPRFSTGHVMRTYPLLALGRYDEAIRACEEAVAIRQRLDPHERLYPWCVALSGFALARSGRPGPAEEMLGRLRTEARNATGDEYVTPYGEALVFHALGRTSDALGRLRDAVNRREHRVTFLGVDPKWDGLRDDPAFHALLARVNLLEVSARPRP